MLFGSGRPILADRAELEVRGRLGFVDAQSIHFAHLGVGRTQDRARDIRAEMASPSMLFGAQAI